MTTFNPLNHPICFKPVARLSPSAWTGHLPFAMFLVGLLKPRIIVELGTYYGTSYCAMCQAVKELQLEARAYAIDTWQGDPQSGYYGPEVLADLKSYHDPLYGGFSRLIQATFDEAATHFDPGTIDLLHIDGFHTYADAKHDFENWLPMMSGRGVILFHDINVREKDFGVRKLWRQIKRNRSSFEFIHSHGLGVLVVGPGVPPELVDFLERAKKDPVGIRDFFFRLGRNLEATQETEAYRQHITNQEVAIDQLRQRAQQFGELAQQIQEKDIQLGVKEALLAERAEQNQQLIAQVQEKDRQLYGKGELLRAAKQHSVELTQENDQALSARDELLRATEQRLTELTQENERTLGIRDELLRATEQRLAELTQEKDRALSARDELLRATEQRLAELTQEKDRALSARDELLRATEQRFADLNARQETRNSERERLTEQSNELNAGLLAEKEREVERANQLAEEQRQKINELRRRLYAYQWTLQEKEGGRDPLANFRNPQPNGNQELVLSAIECPAYLLESGEAPGGTLDIRVNQDTAKLIIGVVTFNNSPQQLSQLSKSIELAVQHIGDLPVAVEVFVVDNGSETVWPESPLRVSQFDSEGNIGFARAMNRFMLTAFAAPATNWFLCLNPDGVLHSRALRELLLCSGDHPNSLVEARQFPEEHLKEYDPVTLETAWASGACLLVRRNIFQEIGGFDSNFFMYLEDVDFSWRARSAGYSIKVAAKALFGHSVLDRKPNADADRSFLLSGRYLAFKWQNTEFLTWAETELVSRGYYATPSDLPPLPALDNELSLKAEVSNFTHYFHFAPARW